MHYLTLNILGLDGDSLANGALGCTTLSERTPTLEVSVDEADGNDGGALWLSPIGCSSDCKSLGIQKGNPEAT